MKEVDVKKIPNKNVSSRSKTKKSNQRNIFKETFYIEIRKKALY